MTALATYSFARGETISLVLDVISGDAGAVSGVVAKLRPLTPGSARLSPSAPVAATFTATHHAATGDTLEGWTLEISDETSATVAAGRYVADARLSIGDGVETTESVAIEIYEPATVSGGAGVP